MFFSIDSIIGGYAILVGEDGRPVDVPAANLPAGAKSGDMVFYSDGKFRPAPNKTAQRRERVAGTLELLLRHGDEAAPLAADRADAATGAPAAASPGAPAGQTAAGQVGQSMYKALVRQAPAEWRLGHRTLSGEDGEAILDEVIKWHLR